MPSDKHPLKLDGIAEIRWNIEAALKSLEDEQYETAQNRLDDASLLIDYMQDAKGDKDA